MGKVSQSGRSSMTFTLSHPVSHRRPSLTHPLDLVPSSNLTMTFSLKLLGRFNPSLQPFFENMNPGFKIYIGDDLIFDYATAGSADDVRKGETSAQGRRHYFSLPEELA